MAAVLKTAEVNSLRGFESLLSRPKIRRFLPEGQKGEAWRLFVEDGEVAEWLKATVC
jgi:hypothetical protein